MYQTGMQLHSYLETTCPKSYFGPHIKNFNTLCSMEHLAVPLHAISLVYHLIKQIDLPDSHHPTHNIYFVFHLDYAKISVLTFFLTKFAALPKSPSRLVSPAVGSRTTLQPAKAIGVSYSIPEPSLTPPPPPPRSPFKASPPRGIRGSTVCKNGRSPTQDGTRREQSLGEHQSRDCLQSPVSPSRLRYSTVHVEVVVSKKTLESILERK